MNEKVVVLKVPTGGGLNGLGYLDLSGVLLRETSSVFHFELWIVL